MATHHEQDFNTAGEVPKPQTKAIWRTFIILVALTAVEFIFAFTMEASTVRNSIFIILTIFKAFYIVGEFMHLKHESKVLIWSILLPMALVTWLMVALIAEGSYYFESITNYFK
ncbi:cytochrome C oxidase subunit IV family protein [Pontibacter sp. BT310]|jgi:cytochrome c oxidase subunit IV|uniref:Cytochrome C oxidase subunit IV family protein n=1 Tax=Pontibacter populi TaxID=890055 RepID=A0ABS6X9J3_9BACT|nr:MULTISPECIES: cytochrome C oxidase subunit IV family protein [Pontibacter]MBJ6116918.1 cytochrome C oxidase subunit IV family protein [Pontibacter sp. BT310]MBR0569342.1 cytochrome C oxidase subunit IV family protein [Microvirga sp. STS03]MBW3363771.1 cytochrome C oxidase subunit IV family protein [Pontibacter populi]